MRHGARAITIVVCLLACSRVSVAKVTPWWDQEKIRFGWGQWHRHQSEGFSVEEMITNITRAGITVFVDAWQGKDSPGLVAKKHGLRYFGMLMVASASWKPTEGRPAVSMLGQTHYQAREAGMNIPPGPTALVPCPLDERIIHAWFTTPCLEMARAGIDGCHIDLESYGFTAFDQLGDYLCYCDQCFGGFTKEKVEPAQRYEWLKRQGRHREYLASLRDRLAAVYRREAQQVWAIKPDFVFSAYPDFSPGELETSWRTEGMALGLHRPQAPFFLIDASHYWPNHSVPWWDSNLNAIHRLGMRHILGTWTGGLFGEHPELDVSAEQWLYDAAVSHDGNWLWFEHAWGPNDLRVQRAAHSRIRAVEKAVGLFLLKGKSDHTFVTTVEQSGDPDLEGSVVSRGYSFADRHLVRVANVNTDQPIEVCVRCPRLKPNSRWSVTDPLSGVFYDNDVGKTAWSADDLRQGVWLSMQKRSDLWLMFAPARGKQDVASSSVISGAILRGHKERPAADDQVPAGATAAGDFPITYAKINSLEYFGSSSPSVNPVLGSSIHLADAVTGTDAKLFGIDGNAWSPALSPDRTRIAFSCYINGKGQIYVMNADGSSVRNLSRNTFCDKTPRWSPDGSQLAFVSDRDGDWNIYVMSVDGSGVRRLTDSPGADRNPAWSPDGKALAFETDRNGDFDIYVVQSDGSRERPLVARSRNDLEPTWSPDGRRLACIVGMYGYHRDVMVVNAEDGSVERPKGLTYAARDWWQFTNVTSIAWSPDGKAIAGAFESWDRSGLFTVNADGSVLRELVACEPIKTYPGGGAAGHQLVGGWYFTGSASPRWLVHTFKDVRWSSDGKTIAFASDMDSSGYFFLHTVSAEGGPITRLDATLNPAGKNNRLVPLRAASDVKKTFGFADSPPGEARYFDGAAYDTRISDLIELAPLPIDGWAFKDDPEGLGVASGSDAPYVKEEFDDHALPRLRLDKFWDDQGYRGLAEGWYRLRWKCPALPPGRRVFLDLGAVDESVWLYLNGRRAAWYDAAQPGDTWDKPLLLEVSGSLIGDGENLLVFRVKSVAGAGGLWKPVTLMVEKDLE